jgi:hypothetical protein
LVPKKGTLGGHRRKAVASVGVILQLRDLRLLRRDRIGRPIITSSGVSPKGPLGTEGSQKSAHGAAYEQRYTNWRSSLAFAFPNPASRDPKAGPRGDWCDCQQLGRQNEAYCLGFL